MQETRKESGTRAKLMLGRGISDGIRKNILAFYCGRWYFGLKFAMVGKKVVTPEKVDI